MNPHGTRRRTDFDLIAGARTTAALWRQFEHIVAGRGFPLFIYLWVNTDGAIDLHTNIPRQHYGNPQDDPFLTYCCNNYGVTYTGAEFLPAYPYLSPTEQAFIAQAQGSGLRSGIGIPLRTRNRPEYGGFNLGTRLSRAEFEAGPAKDADHLRALCLLTRERLEELAGQPDGDPADPLAVLTGREGEIFALLAAGLTRAEIAARSMISIHTADTHIKAIYRKLNIRSQRQAMRIAAQNR